MCSMVPSVACFAKTAHPIKRLILLVVGLGLLLGLLPDGGKTAAVARTVRTHDHLQLDVRRERRAHRLTNRHVAQDIDAHL